MLCDQKVSVTTPDWHMICFQIRCLFSAMCHSAPGVSGLPLCLTVQEIRFIFLGTPQIDTWCIFVPLFGHPLLKLSTLFLLVNTMCQFEAWSPRVIGTFLVTEHLFWNPFLNGSWQQKQLFSPSRFDTFESLSLSHCTTLYTRADLFLSSDFETMKRDIENREILYLGGFSTQSFRRILPRSSSQKQKRNATPSKSKFSRENTPPLNPNVQIDNATTSPIITKKSRTLNFQKENFGCGSQKEAPPPDDPSVKVFWIWE